MERATKKARVNQQRKAASSSSIGYVDKEVATPQGPSPMRSPAGGSKKLSKQMSMRETTREAAWEKRRRQFMMRMRMMSSAESGDEMEEGEEGEEEGAAAGGGEGAKSRSRSQKVRSLTDEDLDELRGSIELGFGFSEEEGGLDLLNTLPALDLYFAINRQLSDSKLHSPGSVSSTMTVEGGLSSASSLDSPSSPASDSWKLLNPGDDPEQVKTRLRHWAQAVACSVRQNC